ncbi:very short patch repair endonuclease [Arthrobacter ginkgonis]|uniref:Very short patch repair endonuclease n=1 Tax=Arthrobacter ginkgonis TaxID=1630594 RepID=A0ABP7D8V5_9MICC
MDRLTPEQRSALMSRIRSKDTGPELRVRRIAHAAGYRYRLHGKVSRAEARRAPGGKLPGGKLPGRPDLVFAGSRKAVFVNGCFWHMHDCPAGRVAPASNAEFWSAKREATMARDARNAGALEAMGWSVLTLWECQLKDPEQVLDRLDAFLGAPA